MRVIADLHGGDPEDVVAVAEFQEIKDRVVWEVRSILPKRLDMRLRIRLARER